MECLGEAREYDYWFFSSVTGDSFTQIFSKDPYYSTLCLTDRLLSDVIDSAFDSCGYTYDYINGINAENRTDHYDRIREYIDRGIPVIVKTKTGNSVIDDYGVICGYEDDVFYYLIGGDEKPAVCPDRFSELIFIKDKKERLPLAEVYRKTVMDIPEMLNRSESKDFSFGIKAFIDWANSFQNGMFDKISVDDPLWYTHDCNTFSCWNTHGNYLCMLGTNLCANGFLERALQLNPDMKFIEKLFPLFQRHNGDGFHSLLGMERGFGIHPKVIKDKNRMKPVSGKILETSRILDEILDVFKS